MRLSKAARRKGKSCFRVFESTPGHLKAFERSDEAFFLAADVAIDKAWTAASFGLATHVWNSLLTDSKVSQLAHRPRMVFDGSLRFRAGPSHRLPQTEASIVMDSVRCHTA